MTSGRRTQAERRMEAERRIIDAAIQLIARQGITKMSFAEIGVEAGVSRGLATHYFGTKENLIVRLSVEITEQFSNALYTPGFLAANGLEKLILYIELYLARAKARPWIARALQLIRAESLIAPPALQQAVAQTNKVGIALISEAIRSGQETGEIRSGVDIDAYTTLITGSLRGIVGQYLAAPKMVDIDALSREFTTMVRAGLINASTAATVGKKIARKA